MRFLSVDDLVIGGRFQLLIYDNYNRNYQVREGVVLDTNVHKKWHFSTNGEPAVKMRVERYGWEKHWTNETEGEMYDKKKPRTEHYFNRRVSMVRRTRR